MGLHLTPEMLVAAYELLRATPPFKRWKLPHADSIAFHADVLGTDRVGDFWLDKGPLIRICIARHKTLISLLETMAHEMIHLRQRTHKPLNNTASHGKHFKRLAAQVCRHHGFDLATF